MSVDADRTAVYAAELAAFDGTDLEAVVGVDAVAALIRAVTAGEWWPGPRVAVVRTRRDSGSSSTRCTSAVGGATDVQIRLADPQSTVATGAHELAHALAGVAAGHDATFRAAYVDVIAVMTNTEPTARRHRLHVEQLLVAFADAGLDVGPRAWPAPPEAATGAIAL